MNGLKIISIRMVLMIVAALGLSMVSSDAWAHTPVEEKLDTTGFDDALIIEEPEVSHAIYGTLESSGDVDFIGIKIDRPEDVKVSIMVPKSQGYMDYFVEYAIVGPGLPDPSASLPVTLPEGWGAVTAEREMTDDRGIFYEPVTMETFYRDTTELRTELDTAGEYFVVVWQGEGKVGDYLLSWDGSEKWGLREMVRSFDLLRDIDKSGWGQDREDLVAEIKPEKDKSTMASCEVISPNDARVTVPPYRNIPPVQESEGVSLPAFGVKC